MRKIVASLVLLAFIAVWIFVAATVGSATSAWPRWTLPLFYIVAGFGWILPIRPLFRWMNSGPQPEVDD
ncbi:DUF2842 domain-containing protein [Hyphomonas johnsonii]|uniref:DUF2842 domain-containing protein n=1 Tax=Hyphomonas johnsonii MHS-2 TaxID=1280950 RepID=A0A059FUY2_9PROT|nr:DUF2842 domain-containing protein [Hyphomonas johnsonii]KCZ94412.1 hypothetical protein HJO_03520 [Hyphomonas johnsonii MHS-2]